MMTRCEISNEAIYELAQNLGQQLQANAAMLGTAESCTGGLCAAAMTMVPGSSAWFDRGLVTYTNQAKIDLLGVQAQTLAQYGAVSEAVATEMATGGLRHSPESQYFVSTTGIAGPGGGTAQKPVGMVCFAVAQRASTGTQAQAYTQFFEGDRHQVRHQAVYFILEQLYKTLSKA
ncbi:CinA family protein [Brackiella oedipodis]|uniref:CinA family protein n=1 Tax=Brackiella oedipodis TaxID=124225 RepID=UPI000686E092|nr:CinA family protein [Brackiella oedipodis]